MYYSRTNGQSDSSKIQCYLILFNVEVSLVTFTVVTAKAKHDRGMDGRTDDGRKILTLVTHNNNNIWHNIFDLDRLCLTKYGSSCQAVYPRSGSRTVTQLSKCMSDVIQMPATAGPEFQPCWNGHFVRFASYFALFWACSTSVSAFLYVCFCFATAAAIFCGLRVTELDIFFSVGKFLSDIWSGTLAFFVGHFEKLSDCPTSPTNFDSTEIICFRHGFGRNFFLM